MCLTIYIFILSFYVHYVCFQRRIVLISELDKNTASIRPNRVYLKQLKEFHVRMNVLYTSIDHTYTELED